MSKQTFHSFLDLDATRFAKDGNRDGTGPEAAVPKKRPAPAPAIEDEASLFLEAVGGSLDISLKHTRETPPEDPPSRRERKAKARAALPAPEQAVPHNQKNGPGPSRPEPRQPSPEETNLFADAMSGVAPIRARGRELAPPVQTAPLAPAATLDMDELLLGKLEFSLEYTDEFVQGHVLGLDPVVVEKLKAGAYSPEAHVDLHGQNMEQAYATLAGFIKQTYQSGKRHLVVVTGRGKNSPGGVSVLRERVQAWFTRDPFKRVVLGFCSARPGDGGAGALYVLLRKRRKNQGKIIWDNKPSEEELLL